MPRRRRKNASAEDAKTTTPSFGSGLVDKKRNKANDDNSIGDLCKSEPNLSLLSSKISSLLSQEFKHAKKLKKKMLDTIINNPAPNAENNLDSSLFKKKGGLPGVTGGLNEDNFNAFKMRLFQAATASTAHMENPGEGTAEDDDEENSKDSM